MSFVASVVVATGLAGGLQMDADAQGRPVLAWERWTREARVLEVADVRGGRVAGRAHRLASGMVALEDLDVAPSGAAVACWRQAPSRSSTRWRVRVARRPAGGAWSRPRSVPAPRSHASDVSCGVSDSGAAVLAWSGPSGRSALSAEPRRSWR